MQQQQFRRQTKPTRRTRRKYAYPVSLRVKLLIGFSVLFSIVFAGAFFWFYTFATDKIMSRLQLDMQATLTGAAKGIDVNELLALYAEGKPNSAGFSDDPRYLDQLAWFEVVHSIEPRAWLYTYTVGIAKDNRRVGKPAVKPEQLEMIYLVDLWANYDPSKAARFLESDAAGSAARQVFREGVWVEEPTIYKDQWGLWLSAFAPLKDKNGKVVAVLGLDIEANYVFQVQQVIRNRVLVSFILTYAVLFVLIYVLSGALTQKLSELTRSAEQIGLGDYGLDLSLLTQSQLPDEMNTLAQVFEGMVESVRVREQMIREGKATEDEMRLALIEEKELNELKSRFVSMVSHELRTPLTVIRTSLELLERFGHVATDEKRQEYFQRSRIAVQNMNHLLEDVLTIGKTDAGRLEFNPSWLNLKQFCHEIVEEVQITGTEHAIAFTPQSDCEKAYLDQKLLRSILTNLLSNAIKYSLEGSTVEFNFFCRDQAVVFEVRDKGIGIPLEDQPRLFELFHRASNVSTIRGTGLGLAIVRQCVAQHQGQITFSSSEGVGTTFSVRLPLCKP